mgnify:CR=1 FL=1
MKIKTLIIFVALSIIFSVNVSAMQKSKEFDIKVPKDFTDVYYGNDVTEVAEILGIGNKELSKTLKDNNIIYFAVSPDKSTQIRVSCAEDDFAKKLGDINNLSQKETKNLFKSLKVGNNADFKTDKSNGRNYIRSCEVLKDSGGEYTVTQYITVLNGKSYYLTCYNNGSKTSKEVEKIFQGFSIEDTYKNLIITRYVVAASIILFMLICVAMAVGIFKKLRKK